MKKIIRRVSALLLVCMMIPANVFGAYTKSVTSGGHAYTIIGGTKSQVTRYSLLDVVYYQKNKDISVSHKFNETVSSSASQSFSAGIKAAAGTEINVFGQKGTASIEASMSSSLGVTNSVSTTISTTLSYNLKKNKDSVGYYAFETLTKGYETYIQFVDVEIKSGDVKKNKKIVIDYMPKSGYRPTKTFSYYKKDPQTSGRYEHNYAK